MNENIFYITIIKTFLFFLLFTRNMNISPLFGTYGSVKTFYINCLVSCIKDILNKNTYLSSKIKRNVSISNVYDYDNNYDNHIDLFNACINLELFIIFDMVFTSKRGNFLN